MTQLEHITDLLIEFDEMGMAPRTTVPDPEAYAREWKQKLTNAISLYASEVAREIFEEIEEGVKAAVSALQFENNPIHRKVKHETYSSLMRFIKTVEEKYTEEGK